MLFALLYVMVGILHVESNDRSAPLHRAGSLEQKKFASPATLFMKRLYQTRRMCGHVFAC